MNLPVFPKVRPLMLEDKPLFDKYFKLYPPEISEFTFTNLFSWRLAYKFQVSSLENCLLVISRKDEKACNIFDPIGPEVNKKEAILKVFSSYALELPVKFCRLPEATVALLSQEKLLKITEDRDNFDYVYSAQGLIDLKGKDFDGKRNFIKRFRDSYAFDYQPITRKNAEECLSFEQEWCLVKDCQHTEGLDAELQAMNEMLKDFDALGLKGAMITIGDKVEAVTLGEVLNPKTFVVHIEKANGNFIGIYQAINQLFIRSEASRCEYVNREQDLGVPGLRKAKESYHPQKMVKKYIVNSK